MTTWLATFLMQCLTVPEMFSTSWVSNISSISIIISMPKKYMHALTKCIQQMHLSIQFYHVWVQLYHLLDMTVTLNAYLFSAPLYWFLEWYLSKSCISPFINWKSGLHLDTSPHTSHCLPNYLDAFLFDSNTTPRIQLCGVY